MMERNTELYSISDFFYQQNPERFEERFDHDRSTSVSLEEDDSRSSAYGVDLSEKNTNLGGKSFTIAAILGLTNADEDVMNLSVQERLQQNQKQLQSYLYNGHEVPRLNDGFCRSMAGPPVIRQGRFDN
ncbi:unnamed protein product [Leptidea sinapis]|uniref:Uncharacterized protein n=1 Tax=Leptidea sinapis TaxID=189913 RepID=A0A5E4R292_9NEOP|nr:unnamed protein product [Leptidea sinapis]